ncbi:MAG: hypothetical protein ABSE73_09460 [Planctomycetota bacterium]
MITDAELRVKGLEALTEALGTVEAEKFVALVMRERFDYTEWRKNLWPLETVEEISRAAMRHRKPSRCHGAKK